MSGSVAWEGCSPARLHPSLRDAVTTFVESTGLSVRITATERTDSKAAEIYAWGRSVVNPHTGPLPGLPLGQVASNAATAAQTAHGLKEDGFAHAVDLHPIPATRANYDRWAAHVRGRSLKAGADFLVGGLPDLPHAETLHWRALKPLPRELQEAGALGMGVALVVAGVALWASR